MNGMTQGAKRKQLEIEFSRNFGIEATKEQVSRARDLAYLLCAEPESDASPLAEANQSKI